MQEKHLTEVRIDRHIKKLPKGLRDFRNFLYLCWKHLNLPVPTPIQYEIAYVLQYGSKREVIEAFRGVGKSWITSAFVVWLLLMDPRKNILVISASKDRADDFSTFTLRLINEIPILRDLIPTNDDRSSKIAFDVGLAPAAHAPSVKSRGITSQITGSRADVIIADDVEVPNNSETQLMREQLSHRIKEFAAILKPKDDAKIIFLGTPQCEDTIYTKLEDRGYNITIWPARYPKLEDLHTTYNGRISPELTAKLEAGEVEEDAPTEPTRFGEEQLMEAYLEYGQAGFNLQFMLNPRLSDKDRYPLKISDLIVHSVDKEVAPEKIIYGSTKNLEVKELPQVGLSGDRYYSPFSFTNTLQKYQSKLMAVDPAGRGQDETGVAVGLQLNSQIHVPFMEGLQGGYSPEVLRKIAFTAKDFGVHKIVIESNMGDGMFSELLKPVLQEIYPCTIEEVRHSVQKEKRIIDTLEPVLSNHRLIIDPKVIQHDYDSVRQYPLEKQVRYMLFYQLSRITREKGALLQDDRLDTLAILVNAFTSQMSQNRDKRMARKREEELQQELKSFMNSTLNFGRKKPRKSQSLLRL